MVVYGKNDELVPNEEIFLLKARLEKQKGIKVKFSEINTSSSQSDVCNFKKISESEFVRVWKLSLL